MANLLQDLRYAVRFLLNRPGVSLLAALCLAIGIGANTAIFSPVDLFMIRPFPYPQANRLVIPATADFNRGGQETPYSPPDFLDFRSQSKTLDIAAYSQGNVNLSGTERPERLQRVQASANLLRVLGVAPELGRDFLAEEERPGSARSTILSHELWETRFNQDRRVLGQSIKLDGMPYTVVGVMPPRFGYPFQTAQLWTPLVLDGTEPRGSHWLSAVARLAPRATAEQARAELAAIALRLEQAYPETNRRMGAMIVSVRDETYGPQFKFGSGISSVAVAFLLLIAAANVANLLLAQAAGRDREIAIRTALGAGRGRVVRQLLTESLILGLAGGVVALGLAWAGIQGLLVIMPAWFPRLNEMGLDGRVLAFGAVVSVAAAAIAGLGPALHATRQGVRESLQEGGRGSSLGRRGGRLRAGFVATEIALAIALASGAGLLAKGFNQLRSVPLGFQPAGMLTFSLTLPATRYPQDTDVTRFRDRLLEQVAALPGVRAVAAGSGLPTMDGNGTRYQIEGQDTPDGNRPVAGYRSVTPGYFTTLGAGLKNGRAFTDGDRAGAPLVAVVNEAFVRRHWPEGGALGHRIVLQSGTRDIVGVVADIREYGPSMSPQQAVVYFPAAQLPTRTLGVALRTAGDPTSLAEPARNAVLALDPDQPVFDVMTMDRRVALQSQANGVVARIMVVLAAVALALALVGVYGVVSYSVSRRTREIGIRMALGAADGDVVTMVVGQSGRVVAFGVVIGVLVAAAMSRGLSIFLFGVSPFDPVMLTLVPLALAGAALLASYLPARRATRVDPLSALRAE
jgi:putative ABC transport system permease protein